MQLAGLANARFAWVIVNTQQLLPVAMYFAGMSSCFLLSRSPLVSVSHFLYDVIYLGTVSQNGATKSQSALFAAPL